MSRCTRPVRANGKRASARFPWSSPESDKEYVIPAPTLFEGQGFRLRLESRGDYLRAQVDGAHDTFEISLAYWSEIARVCHERRVQRVLVVENIAEAGQPIYLEQLIDAIVALGFRDIRVAFVDLFEAHLKAMEHGEILARERGIVGRVFGREDEAERWLRHGIP